MLYIVLAVDDNTCVVGRIMAPKKTPQPKMYDCEYVTPSGKRNFEDDQLTLK